MRRRLGRLLHSPRFGGNELSGERVRQPRDDLLHVEKISWGLVETVGPKMTAACGVDELNTGECGSPPRWTLPSSTQRTFNSRPICLRSIALPLQVKAVWRPMTN
jgi:hypothetical protein